MDIRPPYGYQEIVPLTKQHRVLLPEPRKLPLVFRSITALPLSYTEFAAACRDYPIAFISGDSGRTFVAMAVLGLENQQNLFVTADGAWDAGAYLPAYVRRYPFCMTRVTMDGKEQAERIACVEKRAINDKGEALHDAQGNPSPVWEERKKLLFDYENDLMRSDEMSRVLSTLGLLETFTMQAVPNQGLCPPDLARQFRPPARPSHRRGEGARRAVGRGTRPRTQKAELEESAPRPRDGAVPGHAPAFERYAQTISAMPAAIMGKHSHCPIDNPAESNPRWASGWRVNSTPKRSTP
jgi:hypothetical protein